MFSMIALFQFVLFLILPVVTSSFLTSSKRSWCTRGDFLEPPVRQVYVIHSLRSEKGLCEMAVYPVFTEFEAVFCVQMWYRCWGCSVSRQQCTIGPKWVLYTRCSRLRSVYLSGLPFTVKWWYSAVEMDCLLIWTFRIQVCSWHFLQCQTLSWESNVNLFCFALLYFPLHHASVFRLFSY